MNAPELSSLQKADTGYRELSVVLNESYRGDWDDVVHSSYGQYVKNIEQNADRIRGVYQQANQIIKTSTALCVEKLSNHADELHREAKSI